MGGECVKAKLRSPQWQVFARELVARVTREPDLIGVAFNDRGAAVWGYASRQDNQPQGCVVCRDSGKIFLMIPPARPLLGDPETPRMAAIECPLCGGIGRIERECADFGVIYRDALPQDVVSLLGKDGRAKDLDELLRLPHWLNRTLAQAFAEPEVEPVGVTEAEDP